MDRRRHPGRREASQRGWRQWEMELRGPAETPCFQRRKVVNAHGHRPEPTVFRECQSWPARRQRETLCSPMCISIRPTRRRRSCSSGTPASGSTGPTGAITSSRGGKRQTGERRHLGPLPKKGEWVRLEVEAAKVGLKPGMVISGWAFTQFGGTVYWDKAGIVTRTPQGNQPFTTLSAWVRAQRAAGGAGLPPPIQQIIKLERDKRSEQQKKQLRDYFIENAYAKIATRRFAPLRQQIAALEKKRAAASTRRCRRRWFSRRRPTLKPAYILKRGEYDQRGEQVGRETPKFLPPLPEKASRDRLGLAQWLLSSGSPADGARRGQSSMAAMFRHRPRQNDGRFRLAGRIAQSSEAARLAGRAIPRRWLGHQEDDEAPRDVGDVSAVVAGDERSTGEGSGQSPAVAWAAFPARRRDAARSGVVRQRLAGRETGWAKRQAAAAVRLVGGGWLHRQQHEELRAPIMDTRKSIAAACTRSGSARLRRRR